MSLKYAKKQIKAISSVTVCRNFALYDIGYLKVTSILATGISFTGLYGRRLVAQTDLWQMAQRCCRGTQGSVALLQTPQTEVRLR